MDNQNNTEFSYEGIQCKGFTMLGVLILIPLILFTMMALSEDSPLAGLVGSLLVLDIIIEFIMLFGFFVQQPNEARVVTFFGKYVGTIHEVGYMWINPFCTRRKVSLRIRNMEIQPIKVNDKVGNPVLIGMVLVWKIHDTYRVCFDLDNQRESEHFVAVQSDAALREVTGRFAYDNTDEHSHDEITLREAGDEINNLLEEEINARLAMAGIRVVEARLNYLAYAPEIAAVMLRRQQAAAIITAREKIVEGAVTMVDMALKRIEEKDIVHLTPEKKADMVGNLLLILCGDDSAQPVIPTAP